MRRVIFAFCLCAATSSGIAAPVLEGRWEGRVSVPGKDMPLVVDLAPDATGKWTGSIIIPGLGVNGAPLDKIAVADASVTFVIVNALASATYGPAEFRGAVDADGVMAGEFRQAGNMAPFTLKRSGRASVQAPPRSTVVARDVESQWDGEFELGGYPRHVTITFANHDNTGATATFVIAGKRTTDLPVDLIVQEGNLLRVESRANQVVFEGRVAKERTEIRGAIELGSQEMPLTLRRTGGKS